MGKIGTDENFGDKTGGDRPREHCTIDIGGIDDHHYLNFLFIIQQVI
jgi:hypothetical protein